MSGKFTEDEVTRKLEQLVPSHVTIDRRALVTGDAIVDSLKDQIFRTLNADIDSVYHLIGLFSRAQISLCTKITNELTNLDRFSVISQQDVPSADRAKLNSLLTTAEELLVAGAGRRKSLLVKFKNLTKSFAASSRLPNGQVFVGVDPASARSLSIISATNVVSHLSSLVSNTEFFINAVSNYAAADLGSATAFTQISAAQQTLSTRLARDDLNLSEAVLEAAVLSTLLSKSNEKLDITSPKYDGVVTVASGASSAASITGTTTLPFLAAGYAIVAVDSTQTDTITAAVGGRASITVPLGGIINPTDSGSIGTGDGTTTTFTATLKTTVQKSSITVVTTINGAVTTVVDNGGGLFTQTVGSGFGSGTINYDTGALSLTYTTAPDAAVLETTGTGTGVTAPAASVNISYKYYPLAELVGFDKIRVFSGNTLLEVTIPGPYVVKTALSLSNLMNTVLTETDVDTISSGENLIFRGPSGSLGRLMFPGGTPISLNAGFGAPTWSSTPADGDINPLIGALFSLSGQAFGSDTDVSDLSVSSTDTKAITLSKTSSTIQTSIAPVSVLGLTTCVVDLPSSLAGTHGIQVGDTVEFKSPITGIAKVTVSSNSSITISPPYAFGLTAGTTSTLNEAPAAVSFDVTRDFLTVTSNNNGSTSKLEVTTPGLGLSGTATGATTAVTLASAPPTENTIKPGDVVLQKNASGVPIAIASVSAVSGTTLTLSFNEGVSYTYPPTSLTIVPLGQRSFDLLRPPVRNAWHELRARVENKNFFGVVSAYVRSGSGAAVYAKMISETRSLVEKILGYYASYSSHTVGSVKSLVDFLNEEKMSLPLVYLTTLRFSDMAAMDAAQVSNKASAENLLEELSVSYGVYEDIEEVTLGESLLTDYLNPSSDPLVETSFTRFEE